MSDLSVKYLIYNWGLAAIKSSMKEWLPMSSSNRSPFTLEVGRGLVYVNQSKYYSATYDILS